MKQFPVIYNNEQIGTAHTTREAWSIARPFVGHSDFEAYFDSAILSYVVYSARR